MDNELMERKQKHVAEEYLSSLSDLQCNSKPLINVLTMLAEENIEHAPIIVKVVEQHIAKVSTDLKLPILYLIDSIVKNVKNSYITLFGQCIVNIFCHVFEKVNEKVRERMFALRQTWNEVFPASKLYELDVRVKKIDKNWPITAIKHQQQQQQPTAIHVNPNFLKTLPASDIEDVLKAKTRELLELKKRKLELELEATKKHLEEQEKIPNDVITNDEASNLETNLIPSTSSAQLPTQMPVESMQAAFYGANYVRPTMRMALPGQHNAMPMGNQVHANPALMRGNMNKAKVNPVNPALINLRRDPRLMRQQLQLQQKQQQQQHQALPSHQQQQQQLNIQQQQQRQMSGIETSQQMHQRHASPVQNSITDDHVKHDKREGGGSIKSKKSNRSHSAIDNAKSPTRQSSGRSSSQRSNKTSPSSRDKDRDRKRGTSDTKGHYSSSSNSERRQHKNRDKQTKNDNKDNLNLNVSSPSSRHTKSPSSSPIKSKDLNRRGYNGSGSVSGNNNKTNSTKNGQLRRSNSPTENIVSSTKDVDLRALTTTTTAMPTINDTINLTPISTATLILDPNQKSNMSTTTTTTGAAVKGLEQKTPATITTSATTTPSLPSSSSSSSSGTIKNYLPENDTKNIVLTKKTESMDTDDIDERNREELSSIRVKGGEGKKRVSETGANDEPIPKKSKTTKMDALFGTEDVDLRTLAPPIMAAPINSVNEVLVAPPPPNISSSDDDQKEEKIKKRANQQTTTKSSTSQQASAVAAASSQKVSSNFEDVRAKFAKATKIDRLSKSERAVEKARNKITEINANEDDNTQEANDEKIRIILSQAQEMLESNSISKEKYKQLVQTVMSMNEENKLKEAKRRESLQLQQQQQQQQLGSIKKTTTKETKDDNVATEIDDSNDAAVDVEMMAARDAVLRKRIPKLSKNAVAAANEDPTLTKSPIAESEDARDDISNLNRLKPKEKRQRHTKWSENSSTTSGQRSWPAGGGPNSKRGSNRAAAIPPPPQPPSQPPILVGPTLPIRPTLQGNWQQQSMGGGGGFPPNTPLVRSSVPPPPQPPPINLPPVLATPMANGLPKPCNSIDNPQADLVRTINIDGQSKDIRIYDDVAIVFMDQDEPREIGFQPGQRAIKFDNQETITLRFNDKFKSFMIGGEWHQVRFGFPSRELYIDEHWYEIYFGGPPVSIPIQNRIHALKAEGPPPQVTIGPLRRDLVVGRIHMIVEAIHLFPLFLDARIQTFRYDGIEHTVQFADNLLTVLLDGQPQQVEYGGLPKSFMLKGRRHFIRFTTLPKGVVAGKVEIKNMIYVETEPPAKKPEQPAAIVDITDESNDEPTKTEQQQQTTKADDVTIDLTTNNSSSTTGPLSKVNIDELLQKLVSTGILTNNFKATSTTTTNTNTLSSDLNKKDENTTTTTENNETQNSDKNSNEPAEVIPEEEKLPPIIPIDLSKPDSIKTRQDSIVSMLYLGMQCSNCGVRFPPEQTLKYDRHLDWHFRQNRRERDSTRKAHSRKWYYDQNDWLQYEEIEDLDEREKNFFEAQQSELEALDEMSNQRSTNSPIPTCPAGPEDVDRTCDMCHEKFEHFYNEEFEEWHLKLAIRIEDKIYHPLCYEDYKASLNPTETETDVSAKPEDVIMQDNDNAVDSVIKIEDETVNEEAQKTSVTIADDDDDDDVIVLPNEEPSVTEIDDDEEEYVPVNVTREEMRADNESAMESDVEIQEPHIPFTDLDTYVEKELPVDENTQGSFMNVKIKEEPNIEDEDDGFEDVGTVMYGPYDEISIQSSEETQTQTIISSVDSPATISGERSPDNNMFSSTTTTAKTTTTKENETLEETSAPNADNNISMDGNHEPTDGHHNLSISGSASAVPISSLVNKIKINITKNIAAAANTAAEITTTTTSNLSNSNNGNSSNEAFNTNVNTNTSVISTIPVHCRMTPNSISQNVGNVSNIQVIGSYGNSASGRGSSYQKEQEKEKQQQSQQLQHHQQQPTSSTNIVATRQRTPTPPPIEDTITFELKPALQKATLKKMKKVDCGVETSGLCSIM